VILGLAVVALGVVIYVGKLWAQGTTGGTTAPAARPAEPRTRVALLNLTYVIKNYKKFDTYQQEVKEFLKPYQGKETAWKNEGETLAKEVQNTALAADQRETKQKRLVELQRLLEDNKNEANKKLMKMQEDHVKTLYMDVRAVAERYAVGHNFDMVLHYNDATTQQDYWSPQNIARKMQAGALMPLYYTGGMDISEAVVQTLNASYRPGTR
jgi:Skp family chaperone for outer membrane proteins